MWHKYFLKSTGFILVTDNIMCLVIAHLLAAVADLENFTCGGKGVARGLGRVEMLDILI